MPAPTRTETLDNVGTTTIEARIPELVDGFFGSNPVFARLLQRDGGNGTHIVVGGGKQIRQPLIYNRLPGGSYSDTDQFDTQRRENVTELVFDWSQYYVNITLSGLDLLKNSGGKEIFDLVNVQMDIAMLTIGEDQGTDLFLDGTGNSNKAIIGLRAAIDNGDTVATYGGITRGSTAGTPGNAIRQANINTTGGAYTFPMINTAMGNATIGREKPDLVVTTQALWNSMNEQAQPAQRYAAGDDRRPMAVMGFDTIVINGADVVVDSHVPSQQIIILNTKWIKLITHSERLYEPTGWKEASNDDVFRQQLLWAGQLVVQAPRLQNIITNVT